MALTKQPSADDPSIVPAPEHLAARGTYRRDRRRLLSGGKFALFGFPVSQKLAIVFCLDTMILVLSAFLGFMIRTGFKYGLSFHSLVYVVDQHTGAVGFIVLSSWISLYVLDFYNPKNLHMSGSTALRLVIAMAMTSALLTAFYYIRPAWGFGRGMLALSMGVATVALLVNRAIVGRFIAERLGPKRMLIAGAGWAGRELLRTIREQQVEDFEVVGFVDDRESLAGTQIGDIKVLGSAADCKRLIGEHDVSLLAIAVSHERSRQFLRSIFECKVLGTEVVEMPDLYKSMTYKVPIKHVTDQWFILGGGFDLATRVFLKNLLRLLDLIFATLGLVMALPIVLLCALAIKLTSRGPAFFKQRRVGQFGQEFTLIKLRTMVQDAESETGPIWSQENDPRVTPVGRFLRRTRLDEVPQLWNILKGEMSLVGPRPERKVFIDALSEEIPYYALRGIVKPGVTGWAQVNYKYTNDTEGALEKLQYDLFYIQEMSLFLYVLTIAKTIRTVLSKPGS